MLFKKKIILSAECYAKIMNWVNLCPKEISGLGTMTETKDSIYVDDVYLLDQEVSATETELDPAAIQKLLSTLPPGESNRMRFWWHSHVNMGVFWSTTDYACINTLRGEGKILSIVFNKKDEYKARIDYDDDAMHAFFDDLDMEVEDVPAGVMSSYLADFEEDILEDFDGDPAQSPLDFARFYANEVVALDGHALMSANMKNFCKAEMDLKVKTKVYTSAYYKGGHSTYYKGSTQPNYTYGKSAPVYNTNPKDYVDHGYTDDIIYCDDEDLEGYPLTPVQQKQLEKNGTVQLTSAEFDKLMQEQWEDDYNLR